MFSTFVYWSFGKRSSGWEEQEAQQQMIIAANYPIFTYRDLSGLLEPYPTRLSALL